MVTIVVAILVPRLTIRCIAAAYPHDDPRRHELIAEVYALPWLRGAGFVFGQFATVLVDAIPARRKGTTRQKKDHESEQSNAEQHSWALHEYTFNEYDGVIKALRKSELLSHGFDRNWPNLPPDIQLDFVIVDDDPDTITAVKVKDYPAAPSGKDGMAG
jgi:hypothetical protein